MKSDKFQKKKQGQKGFFWILKGHDECTLEAQIYRFENL